MKNLYDREYYENGIENGVSCYTNYRWIPELTIPMAARIIEFLGIKENMRVLDFGCAKGYLVKALRLLHREAYGFDISDYAISNCPEEVRGFLYTDWNCLNDYDWVISKDVFEHISYDEIGTWLKKIRKLCKNAFVIVPLGEKGKYIVPAYELDATHIIRENLDWWGGAFNKAGFEVVDARYKVDHIKDNWSKWENGNGFFVLK